MRADRALDQASESETSQIVGHLRGGIRATQECCDTRAEIAITETGRYMREAGECLTQGLDARVAEPQRGDPLAPDMKRPRSVRHFSSNESESTRLISHAENAVHSHANNSGGSTPSIGLYLPGDAAIRTDSREPENSQSST
jgi:hypothetical protein